MQKAFSSTLLPCKPATDQQQRVDEETAISLATVWNQPGVGRGGSRNSATPVTFCGHDWTGLDWGPFLGAPGIKLPVSCFVFHSWWEFQKVWKLYSKGKTDFIRGQNTPYFSQLPGLSRNGPQDKTGLVKRWLVKRGDWNLRSVQRRKWSPDRKWSPNWTANDREPEMIPDVDRKDFFNFGIYLFIYFHQLNTELDEHNENIFWQRKL